MITMKTILTVANNLLQIIVAVISGSTACSCW